MQRVNGGIIKLFVFAALVFLIISACKHQQIRLDIVRSMPGYFHNKMHFGEDLKMMQEKNAFLVETGEIDTTSENPPIEIAFISINKKLIQLSLLKKQRTNSGITEEEYNGSGYSLHLTYQPQNDKRMPTQGTLTIEQGALHSSYKVIGQLGYM